MAQAGPRNLISDVSGLRVGNAHDADLRSGVTVLLLDAPTPAAADVRGGGPGTRETRALDEGGVVPGIHALVLSGGSAFGLDAASGVQSYLREQGAGFAVGPVRVPIVPQAVLFDLLNGGDKDWGRRPPYQDIAFHACENATSDFALGSAGAGFGASTERYKGGLGSASALYGDITLGALAAVNAVGNVTIADTHHFWAAPFELDHEFGGRGLPKTWPADALEPRLKGALGENTTLCVVATDAELDRTNLKRLAIMAQAGLARAVYPVNTPLDGDVVFALSCGGKSLGDPVYDLARLGALAADTLARAIARAVFEATAYETPPSPPAYRDLFPQR